MQKRFQVQNDSDQEIILYFEPIPEQYMIPKWSVVDVSFDIEHERQLSITFFDDSIVIYGCPFGDPWDLITVSLDGEKLQDQLSA
jgi:hypothetical protein